MGWGQSVGAGLLVAGGGCCGVADSGSREVVSPRWGLLVVRGAFPGLTPRATGFRPVGACGCGVRRTFPGLAPPGCWLSPRWGWLLGGFWRGVVDFVVGAGRWAEKGYRFGGMGWYDGGTGLGRRGGPSRLGNVGRGTRCRMRLGPQKPVAGGCLVWPFTQQKGNRA